MLSKELRQKIEEADFKITETDLDIEFQKYSPEGQDFSFTIDKLGTLEDLADSIYDYYECYDPSEEAYIWLDSSGHGKNGAPYDMKDVYEDMVACKEMVLELYEIVKSAL